jgi:hypothetical protein
MLLLFIRICCIRRQTVVVYRTLPSETTVVRQVRLACCFIQQKQVI